jgi:DNA-binding transcriptional ArsR family regulator
LRQKSGLEALFPSRCSVRMMSLLLDKGEVSVSQAVFYTGMNHRTVVKTAELLKLTGIVREKRFGRLRVYELVRSSPLAEALTNLAVEAQGASFQPKRMPLKHVP